MKKVLIISPYFPPSNAADMHRIRMSLPYFKKFGWEPTVVCVDPVYSEMVKDEILLKSLPQDVRVLTVKAFSKKWTGKLGLGSIALRSAYFYKREVNKILKDEKFDLIYFSTTQFPVCVLGAYWTKKFNVPYVIDMQDPWHSNYYKGKPKSAQPKKYWFSYRLHKYLEPIAMKRVSGLISVSDNYIQTLQTRYPRLQNVPTATITFGYFEDDFAIAENDPTISSAIPAEINKITVGYVGVVGRIMEKSLSILFEALRNLKSGHPDVYQRLQFFFIGTSYAPKGTGTPTVITIAQRYGVDDSVYEQTDRISYYDALKTILTANALIVPGSDDPNYTASKIYPYIIAKKPLLAIFLKESNTAKIIETCKAGIVADSNDLNASSIVERFLKDLVLQQNEVPLTDWALFKNYTAEKLTADQCALFERSIAAFKIGQ